MKKLNKNLITTTLAIIFTLSLAPSSTLSAAGPASINLGSAGNFVILSKTGISTTGNTSVVGDIGVSPAEATYITGFGLILPDAGAFSTSSLVTGKVYAPSYATPTPSYISTAVSDMQTAYTDAASRAPTVTDELGAGNIGGQTFVPGVYKWGTNVTIPTNLTLSGGANDVWIFQIAGNLNISSATQVVLAGGAQAGNVFWQVAGQTTLGTTAVFNGNILDQTAIVLNTGAVLNGRALAQSAVTLDANPVTIPVGIVLVTTPPVNSSSGGNSSSSTTATVAQSNSPVTTTYSGGNTQTTISTGCSGGNKFNTSTGEICINNATPSISGCNNKTTGFSTITGQSCVGNFVNNNATTSTYNFGTVTLKNGSKGDAVMELQRFLNAKLSLGLVIDGKLGPKTIAVIKKWQKDNGLVSDGLIGTKTKAEMNAQAN